MSLLTIVEDYIQIAMKPGIAQQLEDGTFVATTPLLPGIVGSGADRHESLRDLSARIESWIQSSLAGGRPVPVIEGIDLNSESGQILASYRRLPQASTDPRVVMTPDEFEAALADPSLRPH